MMLVAKLLLPTSGISIVATGAVAIALCGRCADGDSGEKRTLRATHDWNSQKE
jgi:hypothetical protein